MQQCTCPICNSGNYRKLGKPKISPIAAKFIREEYRVAQCSQCATYFITPAIDFSASEWEKLYQDDYFGGQNKWLLRKRKEELEARLNALAKSTSLTIGNFLDVGCGEGKALIEAQKRGWNAWGLDIVDHRMEEAKHENIQFRAGTLLDIQLPEQYFDCVYVDSVLEHVLNPKAYLLEIYRIMKKDAVVYIGVPNEDALINDARQFLYTLLGQGQLSAKLKPFDNPYHVIGFNKQSLLYAVKECNFQVATLRNFSRKLGFLSYTPRLRGFWIGLYLLPFEFLGLILGRDVYWETILRK